VRRADAAAGPRVARFAGFEATFVNFESISRRIVITSLRHMAATSLVTIAIGNGIVANAFAQSLPTTGTVKSRLGNLEFVNGFPTNVCTVPPRPTSTKPGCCPTPRR